MYLIACTPTDFLSLICFFLITFFVLYFFVERRILSTTKKIIFAILGIVLIILAFRASMFHYLRLYECMHDVCTTSSLGCDRVLECGTIIPWILASILPGIIGSLCLLTSLVSKGQKVDDKTN